MHRHVAQHWDIEADKQQKIQFTTVKQKQQTSSQQICWKWSNKCDYSSKESIDKIYFVTYKSTRVHDIYYTMIAMRNVSGDSLNFQMDFRDEKNQSSHQRN